MSPHSVHQRMVSGLIVLIEKEMTGDSIDRSLVASLVKMLCELRLYSSQFEKPFLIMASKVFSDEAQSYFDRCELAEYLKHVDWRLSEESKRVAAYLDPTTFQPLLSLVDDLYLRSRAPRLCEKGLASLLQQNRLDDLSRMFNLFSRVNELPALRNGWLSFIKASGMAIVLDEMQDENMVQNLLDMKDRLDAMLNGPFNKHPDFQNALREAFEMFINSRQNKPAELVAKYIDNKLKSVKGVADADIEQLLDRVLIIFRFINGKDVFEAFYKKDLAKRLLLSRSASFDVEKAMIARLKIECGAQFTSKLEIMFKDINLSKEILEGFETSRQFSSLSKDTEIHVFVLTFGFWPAYSGMVVKIPSSLAVYQTAFEGYYHTRFQGRKITWQPSLGMCMLKSRFAAGSKELSVSFFQALVLLLFNGDTVGDNDGAGVVVKLSFNSIKEQTGIEVVELKRTLQSLACGKVRVLTKIPKGRDVDDTDSFVVNDEFTNPLMRIKINSIQLKETAEEQQATTEKVFHDRQFLVDAAIVRIMKSRKQLSHTQLISEVFSLLKFPMKQTDVKARIESLIEREYLQREGNGYAYLA